MGRTENRRQDKTARIALYRTKYRRNEIILNKTENVRGRTTDDRKTHQDGNQEITLHISQNQAKTKKAEFSKTIFFLC
jgi:hypothetical protein